MDPADIPRWIRIIPGLVGLVLLLKTAGFSLAVYEYKDPFISIYLFIFIFILLLIKNRKLLVKRTFSDSLEVCRSYAVKAREPETASNIVEVIKERAKRGYSGYILLSLFDKNNDGSTRLLLCGRKELLDREVEIFETIIAALVKGARLEFRGEMDARPILDLFVADNSSDSGLYIHYLTDIRESSRRDGEKRIYLGETIETPLPEPVYLTMEDLEGHIGIYGSTGSGKSTTLRIITDQAAKFGWKSIVVDWTGEHSLGSRHRVARADRGDFPVPLVKMTFTREGRRMLVDILASSLGLSDPQAYLLGRILDSPVSSALELLSRIDSWPEESGWDREVKRGLRRRLAILTDIENALQGDLILEDNYIVVDVSSIKSPRARRVYALSLLSYLYLYIREKRIDVLVAVDEAHNLFNGDSSLFEELLSEARKFGLHVIYATQAPSMVPDRVFLNTNTKIVHALRSQRDKQTIQAAMGLGDDKVHLLDKLVRGEALVQAPSIPEPVLVKVKPFNPFRDVVYEGRIHL
ncbi:MAG: ATP-binding protein [Desulfurococcales archaeon]|nr:ATP-binding protein [Desulfurococcales archaeon]